MIETNDKRFIVFVSVWELYLISVKENLLFRNYSIVRNAPNESKFPVYWTNGR